MKRILYANGSILTGDDIARSVVRYAMALAQAGSADTIRVPIVADRRIKTIEMMIGPASQLIVEHADHDPEVELDERPFIDDLDGRVHHLKNPPPIGLSAGMHPSYDDI